MGLTSLQKRWCFRNPFKATSHKMGNQVWSGSSHNCLASMLWRCAQQGCLLFSVIGALWIFRRSELKQSLLFEITKPLNTLRWRSKLVIQFTPWVCGQILAVDCRRFPTAPLALSLGYSFCPQRSRCAPACLRDHRASLCLTCCLNTFQGSVLLCFCHSIDSFSSLGDKLV